MAYGALPRKTDSKTLYKNSIQWHSFQEVKQLICEKSPRNRSLAGEIFRIIPHESVRKGHARSLLSAAVAGLITEISVVFHYRGQESFFHEKIVPTFFVVLPQEAIACIVAKNMPREGILSRRGERSHYSRGH